MKKAIHTFLLALCCATPLLAQSPASLPREIYSGPQGKSHCQGIAYDKARQCMYMSFTTSLIKTDLQGRLLASVNGLTGHLGCMAINPDDGRLYASLEYKHDAIGKSLGSDGNDGEDGFYVAIFDLERITRTGMDASEVMTTVYIKEAVDDYTAQVTNQGKAVAHRHGCSGIDGLALAPRMGKQGGPMMLYTAYGVYSDKGRTDNDYQVILCYDISKWKKYEQPLSAQNLHKSGPKKPARKYFVRTGNTSYGIQNLAYDAHSGSMLAAVYPGKKENWPNYSLFVIDTKQKPAKQSLMGFDKPMKGHTLSLAPRGKHDAATDTWGYNFDGSTGICPLGEGYFYISHPARVDGKEQTTIRLHRWDGGEWTLVE